MDDSLKELIARLSTAYRRGSRLALIFDYDGTLTPIVEHPTLARLHQRTLLILNRLAWTARVGVGIVSGRGLSDLQSMVELPGLYYAGATGLELDLRGERVTHPEAESHRSLITAVANQLGELSVEFPGAWVEDKRLALTLHYRRVQCQHREGLLVKTRETLGLFNDRLRIHEGPMALEIVPHLSWDKGSAVRYIVQAIGQPVTVLYAGDAANDGDALAAAAALGGIALAIGAAAPLTAHYRLDNSEILIGFLHHLELAIADPGSASAEAAPVGESPVGECD